jgi:RNAse (barnase) inhibitor barstar
VRASAAGVAVARIDGDAIGDKAAFLGGLASTLHFPPYFGRNWDALADCLTDRAVLPAGGQILLFDHPAPLIRQSPATWEAAEAVFVEAATYWREQGRLFSVIVRRTGGLLPTVPILDR